MHSKRQITDFLSNWFLRIWKINHALVAK